MVANTPFLKKQTFPTFPADKYKCRVTKIELTERVPFQAPEGTPKEPAIRFYFDAVDVDAKSKTEIPIIIDGKPVDFRSLTGVDYGGETSTNAVTKIVDGIVGRHLTDTELENLNFSNLENQSVYVMVTLEPKKTGGMINKVVSVTRVDGIPMTTEQLTASTPA